MTAQEYIKEAFDSYPDDALAAWGHLNGKRQGNTEDAELRDAEHYMFAQWMGSKWGDAGRAAAAALAPAYSGAKALAQALPASVGQWAPGNLYGASRPSAREALYGAMPLLQSMMPQGPR